MLTPEVITREWIYAVSVPIVIALVQLAKNMGLPGKWAPVISLVLGLFFAFGTVLAVPDPYQHWFVTILSGCMLGLSASGLYSGVQAFRAPVDGQSGRRQGSSEFEPSYDATPAPPLEEPHTPNTGWAGEPGGMQPDPRRPSPPPGSSGIA